MADIDPDDASDVPAPEAGEAEDAALWAELEAADTKVEAAPPQGRDDADDPPEPQAKAAEPDLWASAPPELRQAYEAAQRRAQELEHYVKSNEGRVASYQRQYEDLRKQLQPQAKAPTPLPDIRNSGLAKIAEEYPEIGGPLTEILSPIVEELKEHRQARAADEISRRDAALGAAEAALKQQHPDFVEVIAGNRATFDQWLGAQPRPIREAYARNEEGIVDPEEAGFVVGLFKQHIGVSSGREPPAPAGRSQQLADRRQRLLESAESPRTKAPAVASGIPEIADEETLWKMWDEEDRRKEASARR